MRPLVFVTLAVVHLACAGSAPGPAPRPDWVDGRPTRAQEPNVLYAVGAKAGLTNPALLLKAADNQARAEMQATFSVYTATLMKDYMASYAEADLIAGEQRVAMVLKTFSAGFLGGVEIVDHWQDPTDGTMYSLARLSLDPFVRQIEEAQEMSPAVKDRIRRAAQRAFAELHRNE